MSMAFDGGGAIEAASPAEKMPLAIAIDATIAIVRDRMMLLLEEHVVRELVGDSGRRGIAEPDPRPGRGTERLATERPLDHEDTAVRTDEPGAADQLDGGRLRREVDEGGGLGGPGVADGRLLAGRVGRPRGSAERRDPVELELGP